MSADVLSIGEKQTSIRTRIHLHSKSSLMSSFFLLSPSPSPSPSLPTQITEKRRVAKMIVFILFSPFSVLFEVRCRRVLDVCCPMESDLLAIRNGVHMHVRSLIPHLIFADCLYSILSIERKNRAMRKDPEEQSRLK